MRIIHNTHSMYLVQWFVHGTIQLSYQNYFEKFVKNRKGVWKTNISVDLAL